MRVVVDLGMNMHPVRLYLIGFWGEQKAQLVSLRTAGVTPLAASADLSHV